MPSSRLSLSDLAELCRVLRHCVGAGLTLRDVFRQLSARGRPAVRSAAARVSATLEHGQSLEEALKNEADRFPPLFVSLLSVGERTGMLPEVAADLEKYYSRQLRLRKKFLSQITWPVIQFFLAVFVLATLIWVLGFLAKPEPGKEPFDPLGLGLRGGSGALIFLGVVFGTLGGGAAVFVLARQRIAGGKFDAWLLGLPAVGPCLRVLAMGRFCLAFSLTSEAGMVVHRALRLSMRATGNNAFIAASGKAEEAVRSGDEITSALGRTRLFPEEFLHIVAVGEESGSVPEVLRKQAEHYDDEAGRRLKTLANLAGGATWVLVAVLIIIAIFRIFLSYISQLA
jgi:type IV pilus assembly protein PilC